MSEFRLKPELRECFVTYIDCNDKEVIIWSQSDINEVFKFEAILHFNYNEMFKHFFTANRVTIKPIEGKYYVFCDKSKMEFYRVLVRSVSDNQSVVHFIDYGYEESVPIDCLFIYQKMFNECKSLAQKFILSDIRPKNNGFNSEKVVKSLQKFVKSILIFGIFEENKIQVFDRNGEQIIKRYLQNFEDIVIINESNGSANDLIAIEFADNSSSLDSSCNCDQKTSKSIEEKKSSEPSFGTTIGDNTSLDSSLTYLSNYSEEDKSEEKNIQSHEELEEKAKLSRDLVDRSEEFLESLISSTRKVIISSAENCQRVFCRLYEEQTLEPLVRDLSDYYSNREEKALSELEIKAVLEKEIIICVYFQLEDKWLRARVTHFLSTQEIRVLFLDFGTVGSVRQEDCRLLADMYFSPHILAISCEPKNRKLKYYELKRVESREEPLLVRFLEISAEKVFFIEFV